MMALAQAREILVTELSRWGRSTIDLVQTLQSLQAWDVSVLAVSGLQFDLSTPHGKMIASVMSALASSSGTLSASASSPASPPPRPLVSGSAANQDSVHPTARRRRSSSWQRLV
jgi:Resolvase, N terminal domain